MTREELLDEVRKRVKTPNLHKHILAVEAVMRALAKRLVQDEDRWGAAGLLHDIDYEETREEPARHSLVSGQIAKEMGFDSEIVQAVEAHNEAHGLPRNGLMAKALYSVDPLTGLIVASALISPGKKLKSIDAEFVLHRMGEKAFAKGANRDAIRACSELGLELGEFVDIALKAMQGIAGELGL